MALQILCKALVLVIAFTALITTIGAQGEAGYGDQCQSPDVLEFEKYIESEILQSSKDITTEETSTEETTIEDTTTENTTTENTPTENTTTENTITEDTTTENITIEDTTTENTTIEDTTTENTTIEDTTTENTTTEDTTTEDTPTEDTTITIEPPVTTPIPPNLKCDETLWLECHKEDERCWCRPDLIRSNGTCNVPADGNCDVSNNNPKCVLNASCTDPPNSNSTKCVCETGFLAAPNGFCYLGHQENCQETRECNQYASLVCYRGKCTCQNPLMQWWSEEEKKCISIIGGQCDDQIQSCIPNADCVNDRCVCKEGFLESDYFCLVDYGGICVGPDDCYKNYQCNNGICGCYPDELYDPTSTVKCAVKSGEACKQDKPCIKNSQCDQSGHCTCLSEYLESEDKRCAPVYRGECVPTDNPADDECKEYFPDKLLQCNATEHKCLCPELYDYITGTERCYGRLDANCANSTDCHVYASCSDEGFCICGDDYVRAPSGECLKIYGTNCNSQQARCNSYEFLICSDNGQCMCENPENNIYDEVSEKCVGFPESPCMTEPVDFKQRQCIQNSSCVANPIGSVEGNGTCVCDENFVHEESTKKCISLNDANSLSSPFILLLFVYATKTTIFC